MANRYYLQHDYAKSFLLNNKLTDIEKNPQPDLLNYTEEFVLKPDKNEFEKYILRRAVKPFTQIKTEDYIHHVREIIYLTKGELEDADSSFKRMKYNNNTQISSRIFGYNLSECMDYNGC